MASTPAQQLLQPSAIQRLLVRVFQPSLASNAFFGVLLGGLVATVVGVVSPWLILVIAHAMAPHVIPGNYYGPSGEDRVNAALRIVSLHSLWRESLQLFLIMHGVGIHSQYVSSSSTDTYTYSSNPIFNGLLLIPAVLLTLGGYIAASTDFQNRRQSSLLRGAAIAIPCVILLFILMSQVNGCIPDLSSSDSSTAMCAGGQTNNRFSVDGMSLFLLGTLWSVLFGLLGASLKLAQGQWRHRLFQYFRASPRPQLTGMITGSLVAAGLGISLSLLFVYGFLAYTPYSVPIMNYRLCYPGDWQILTLWGIAQGPVHAINLFFFSFGAPVSITNSAQGSMACFYTNEAQASITLRDGELHLQPWVYTVLLLPAVSLFLGGRVSAALGRVQGMGPSAVQGALIAFPFAVLMMLLTLLSTIIYTYSLTGPAPTIDRTVRSAGVSALDLLLWALLSGAVFGALGGIYQTSALKISVSRFLSQLAILLRQIHKPGYVLLDRLSKQSLSVRRSATCELVYSAFLWTLLLMLVAGVAGIVFIALNQTLSFQDNQRITGIISVLLVALPGLLLLSACATTLATDPLADQSNTPARVF